jgi:8-oxo-dGTP diphosphatase
MSLEPPVHDWPVDWKPRERATLLFVVKDGRVLLILKKRGLGAGKVNGPGGRIDPGETPEQCAVRETQEELCVTPTGLTFAGELMFQFVGADKLSGHSIHGYVFRADDCVGEPTETDEAVPLWTDVNRVPYERMWQDDALWLPLLLKGERFVGRFYFEGDRMLWHDVKAG